MKNFVRKAFLWKLHSVANYADSRRVWNSVRTCKRRRRTQFLSWWQSHILITATTAALLHANLAIKLWLNPLFLFCCVFSLSFFLISRCLASWSDSAWPRFYVCMSMCMQISVFFSQLHSTSEIKDKHNTSVSCIARLLSPIYHL